ncbi:hypothetical protein ISS07_03345 [Candidatus Woesearchaeota archaeon]|nr:hypothetical protein [Candidatus Woesearchaeota archaeon]
MIETTTTGHSHIGYLNEDSLVLDGFNQIFNNDFSEFVVPETKVMNNKQKSNVNLDYKMSQRRLKIRTKEEFILEVKRLSKIDKKFLNYSYLRKIKRSDLLWEAQKHFNGWRNAVQAAGFRPIQKGWTKKEIISEINKIVSEKGLIPRSKEVGKLGCSGLSRAANRKFGSWTNALIEAGFKPFRIKWTEETAIRELKEFHEHLGHSPSMRELKKSNKYDLLNAGLKFFGKYNNFLQAANLPIVLEMNKWPKQKIIFELNKIADKLKRTPRRTELAAMGKYDIINAAERHFPSWSEAIIAAKLLPNSDVLEDDLTWREWENLIFDIIKKKSIIFSKKEYIKKVGYPDIIIPSEKKVIEIKINCSDNSVKKDIQKYLPLCKSLEIWYLFGKPFSILSNKVKFVGPNKIKEMIKNDRVLLKKFYKIKNGEIGCET